MPEILLLAVLWLGTHLGLSLPFLRRRLVALIGEPAFLGFYSLVALASLGALVWGYSWVPRMSYLWLPDPALYWVPKTTMLVACVLLAGGFMVRNPTQVGGRIDSAEAGVAMARGVSRITRHPVQWAVILWAGGHIVANGDAVSVIFFMAFLLLSLCGSMLMDHKKGTQLGAHWQAYAGVTSNLPFLAVLQRRNRVVAAELLGPVLVGCGVYALLYVLHEYYTGALII